MMRHLERILAVKAHRSLAVHVCGRRLGLQSQDIMPLAQLTTPLLTTVPLGR